jgi:hypothetical protein
MNTAAKVRKKNKLANMPIVNLYIKQLFYVFFLLQDRFTQDGNRQKKDIA